MTALLEDRVACFLADRPDSTVPEILRAAPCLTKTLEEILANPLFTERGGRWRLGEETNGLSVSSPSGQAEPPDSTANAGRSPNDLAAHQQLALVGEGFRREAA